MYRNFQEFIASIIEIGTDYWTGANDIDEELNWVWLDGTPVNNTVT